jgi:hypothetical protein
VFAKQMKTLVASSDHNMPLSSLQTAAIKEVIQVILAQTATRGKRQLAAMFMDLVDRQEWPQYYEVHIAVSNLFFAEYSKGYSRAQVFEEYPDQFGQGEV